jgi:hypothetical protein
MLACSIFYITQHLGAQKALNKILPEFLFHKKYEAYWIDMGENEIPLASFRVYPHQKYQRQPLCRVEMQHAEGQVPLPTWR